MGIGRPWKAVLLVAVGAAGGGAALAVASVPDSTGVIHACVTTDPSSGLPMTNDGNVRIIDSPAQSCAVPGTPNPHEASIAWNTVGQPGPPGQPGASGAPGRSVTIAGGNTFTISGGQVITVGQSPGLTIKPPAFGGKAVATLTLSGGVDLTSDVLSYGLTNTGGGGGGGTGAGARKVQFHEFQFSRKTDKSSAKLALACANGTHIKKAVLTLRKAGKTYLTYTMSDALVSSFQGGANPHDQQPAESLSLNFTKIEFKYTPQK